MSQWNDLSESQTGSNVVIIKVQRELQDDYLLNDCRGERNTVRSRKLTRLYKSSPHT